MNNVFKTGGWLLVYEMDLSTVVRFWVNPEQLSNGSTFWIFEFLSCEVSHEG